MRNTELSDKEKELLAVSRDGNGRFYNAGFNGETFKAFPNFTSETTADEELQMVSDYIDKVCDENGWGSPSPQAREVMKLLNMAFIASYREGLAARSLLKECSSKKESA
jgi:hypothetical protein